MHAATFTPAWKQILAGLLLPVSVAASLGAFVIARESDADLELVVMVAAVATLLLATIVERLVPYAASWNRTDGDTVTDLSSAVVLVGLVEPALKFLAPLVAVALYAHFDASGAYATLFGRMPFPLQMLVVTLLIELGRYWMHRLHHVVPSLWWLHALHHGSRRLYAFNTLRFHPLNHVFNFAVSVLPFILIGIPAEVLLGYLAIAQPVVMLQHANVDARNGLLNYVFSSNEIHRWHHSAEAAEANCNYGAALVLWDQVFGSFRYRRDGERPTKVGLFAGTRRNYPSQASYLAQLRSMLRPECCRA